MTDIEVDIDVEYWVELVDGWSLVAYGDGPGRPIHVRGYPTPRPEPVHVAIVDNPDADPPVFDWDDGWWRDRPRTREYVEQKVMAGYRARTAEAEVRS